MLTLAQASHLHVVCFCINLKTDELLWVFVREVFIVLSHIFCLLGVVEQKQDPNPQLATTVFHISTLLSSFLLAVERSFLHPHIIGDIAEIDAIYRVKMK